MRSLSATELHASQGLCRGGDADPRLLFTTHTRMHAARHRHHTLKKHTNLQGILMYITFHLFSSTKHSNFARVIRPQLEMRVLHRENMTLPSRCGPSPLRIVKNTSDLSNIIFWGELLLYEPEPPKQSPNQLRNANDATWCRAIVLAAVFRIDGQHSSLHCFGTRLPHHGFTTPRES